MSDSVRPHRQQPTRLPRPWDSPGKNTRVGCHFLLQCMEVKSESEVAQSCPTLSDPMDCSLPGSSIHEIFQARVLACGAIALDKYKCCDSTEAIFPVGSADKVSACSAEDVSSIPGSGRSPGEGNGGSLQDSCLKNPMYREAWQAIVHGIAKSWTRLSSSNSRK